MAARRVLSLLDADADVTVVAPEAVEDLSELARSGKIHLLVRTYEPDVLEGAFLVIVATNDAVLNASVSEAARTLGCLVNDTDEPERGDCLLPAVVRRGDLVISITTSGASPSLASRIQNELSNQFGQEYEGYIALLGEVRQSALSQIGDAASRKRKLAALAADEQILKLVRMGKIDDARARAFACISPLSD